MLVVATVSSFFLVPVAMKIAQHFDAVDYPNERRINKTAIPRMGGIAVYASLMISFAVFWAAHQYFDIDYGFNLMFCDVNVPIVLVSITLIFLLGCIDDVLQIKASFKFMGQIVAALIAVQGGLIITSIDIPLIGISCNLGFFSYILTVFLFVSFSNIVNLIDGLDGLATGISIIAALAIMAIALSRADWIVVLFTLAFIGSLLGFLKYNLHPALIFLGDSGSLLIGFLFGVLIVAALGKTANLGDLFASFIIFGLPIADTFCAIVRRKKVGVSIGTPDKGHIHHRLMKAGRSHLQTVLHMHMWTFCLALAAVVASVAPPLGKAIILSATVLGLFLVARKYDLYMPLKEKPEVLEVEVC